MITKIIENLKQSLNLLSLSLTVTDLEAVRFYLLDSIKRLDEVIIKKKRSYNIKQIICLETGVIYKSAGDLSKELDVNLQTIYQAISTNSKIKGYYFTYLE